MPESVKRVQVFVNRRRSLRVPRCPLWGPSQEPPSFKHGLNNTGAPMLTFKGFRRPTAKLAMPHVPNLDISIAGTELEAGGAQTVYVIQARAPAS